MVDNGDFPDINEFYQLDKEIGEGAFGKVKKAYKIDTGEPFAVKIINKDNMEQTELEALQQEVEILTQIDHPNIVKLYEVFEDDQYFYMVLELMTGGELFERIVEQDHFSEKKAVETIKPIIDALQYCHQMGVVHRDLKPENLLYATKDPGSIIKISDFGLARFTDTGVMSTMCGTPSYVAPEIIDGKQYNKAIDFWSVGVILYIMLCGYPPFQSEDNDELFNMIKKGEYEFDQQFWNCITQEAKDLISGLLAKVPEKRLGYDQIMNHDWVQGKALSNNQPIVQIKQRLKDFNAKRQFRKFGAVFKAVNMMQQQQQQQKQ